MSTTSEPHNNGTNGTSPCSNGTHDSSPSGPKTYAIDIRYFLVMLLSSMSVFFTIGVMTAPLPHSSPSTITSFQSTDDNSNNNMNKNISTSIPPRRTHAKHSSEIGRKLDDTTDLNERHVNFEQPSYEDLGTGEGVIQRDSTISPKDDTQVEHLPAGQHLLVDIKNVSAKFLNSEQRLADAMVTSVKSAGLTLLSYHCHSLIPAGVSCVGVLLESHISFQTWPEEGVITLDLFTCGENPLLPVVPVLERLFGIPRSEDKEKTDHTEEEEGVVTMWSHELRGFRHADTSDIASETNYLDSKSDLAKWIVNPLRVHMKQQVAVTTSEFQRIDVWDLSELEEKPTYEDGVKNNFTDNDPRWMDPQFATPNRLLFLNGHQMTMSYNYHEYFESLVQPAMFANPNPVKNVVIVGGAGGSAVREALKHKSVQSISVIEPDQVLVDILREHFAFMIDCSDLVGVADNCLDDDRVTIINEQPKTWFMNQFSDSVTEERPFESIDTVIFDTIDPKYRADLYEDALFLKTVMSSLSQDGTVAFHMGDSHTIHTPREEYSAYATRGKLIKLLEADESTGAMFVYEEAHTGQEIPTAFLTVCKNVNCRDTWFAEAIVVDYQISTKVRETVSGASSLVHFDGATQHSFQIPPRAWEEVYCRRDPVPFECAYRGLDLSKDIYELYTEEEDAEHSSFEIVTSEVEDGDETKEITAIYALEDIPAGSYIMPSDVAASFTISEYAHQSLKNNTEVKNTGDMTVINNFLAFIEEYGHETMSTGSSLKYVEVGASFMIRKSSNAEEVNIGRWMPHHPSGKQPAYSPVYDRHMVSYDVFLVATKDIKEGEELIKPMDLWSN